MEKESRVDLTKVNVEISKEIKEKIEKKEFVNLNELENVNIAADMPDIVEYNGRVMVLSEYERIKEEEKKNNK